MPREDQVHRVGQVHRMSQGALDWFRRALEQVPETLESVHETLEQVHRVLAAVRGVDLPWANPAIDPPSFAYNR
ncbi:MAG: hypothetical protein HY713_08680 [candidate division NC10 bacterium]|nr:hypothetical protein [candidate division NC10 bacterium]